jgi:amino acid adenylation domain-containing protein
MGAGSLVEAVIEGAGRASPGKLAVIGEGQALTFGELLAGAWGIAAALSDSGVGPGDRVGIWMDKTPRSVQALLGAMAAGAAYVPLDPRAPWRRCRAIALDCQLAALVVDSPRLEALPALLEAQSPKLVLADCADERRAAEALGSWPWDLCAGALQRKKIGLPLPGKDDVAYVLYTSGSTGTPKGVVHTHGSGLSFVRWVQQRFGIRPDDVFSSHAPFHFDLSISDLWAALASGSTVRLLTATEAMVAPYLVRVLDEWAISVWYSVPSILIAMLESGGLESRVPAQLRLLLFAGEVFPTPQLRRLRRALPRVRLVNLFGPTETNVCTFYEVLADIPDARTVPIPIGRGCENLETFLLDDEGRDIRVPGVEGTLWVKGGNLMRGYWNDPERTARVLQPDPRGGSGLACCTGDRVRLQPDGNYEFRGRRDHMVKTRGYRVELGEIEAVLAAHPAVREAVAVPIPDPQVGSRIVASVVPRAGSRPDLAELRLFSRERLPSYMIPERIEVRAELPRTSTGKADRGRLTQEWMGQDAREGERDGEVEGGA